LWLADDAGPVGAGVIVLGAYLFLAFSRFGWPDFAIRPTTRFMLTGLYGWMWLAASSWLVARMVSGSARMVSGSARVVSGSARVVSGSARVVSGSARVVSGSARMVSGSAFLRLTGQAHVPLLFLALFIQLVSVTLSFTDAALWPALFVGVFWMPAQLVHAVAAASGLRLRRAVLVAAGPYLGWAAVVGRHLWGQLGHLL
jgi:hypothetical protein